MAKHRMIRLELVSLCGRFRSPFVGLTLLLLSFASAACAQSAAPSAELAHARPSAAIPKSSMHASGKPATPKSAPGKASLAKTQSPAAQKPAVPLTVAAREGDTFLAPMPDPDVHAPQTADRPLSLAPMFNRPSTSYRGESFTAGSTTDPGMRGRGLPISGFSVRMPLD